ncbi:unnamed protein product [Caenorhabditis angaria]|uniref:G-protein coupled receptors family 1 profile domain-containing protein n=1 Tax=Caenorhabditis angaria TaxID=860376 RepID=A0A9P1N3M4_9PELO|nr:unnamed protein product [Caenorhabditis angaria]
MDITTCEEMENIANYAPLSIALLTFTIISIIGVPMVIYLIFNIFHNSLYHSNTKILLLAHCFFLLLHLLNRIFLHSLDLYRWHITLPKTNSGCDILLTSNDCFFYRFIFNCGIWFSGTTPLFIIIERYLATVKITTYQNDKKYGFLLIVAQIMVSGFFLSMLYNGYSFGTSRYYCMTAKPNMSFYKSISLLGIALTQVLAVIGLQFLFQKNMKIQQVFKEQGVHLLKRYQVEETLRSLKTLKQPIYTMFISQFLFTSCSFFCHRYGFHFAQEDYYVTLESFVLLPEYSRLLSNLESEKFYTMLESLVVLPEYTLIFVITFIQTDNRIKLQGLKN